MTSPTPPASDATGWFRGALELERDCLQALLDRQHPDLPRLLAMLAETALPVVVSGVGKSGLVAAKIAATFSSLGTPAFFLNAGEAAHGDLGAVTLGSIVLLLSKSGSTTEILRILPQLRLRRCVTVGLLGNVDSPIGRAVDLAINAWVAREADHLDMAPTASTTLQMAIGDALAVAVSRLRGFSARDFVSHHPAGNLGRHLVPLRDIMRRGDDLPTVAEGASVAEILTVISAGRIGGACVTDVGGRLRGLIVDGDIRRLVQARVDLYSVTAAGVMSRAPMTILDDATIGDAWRVVRGDGRHIAVLPVLDADGILVGIVHAHDLA